MRKFQQENNLSRYRRYAYIIKKDMRKAKSSRLLRQMAYLCVSFAINNKNHKKCWFCDRVAGEIWFDEIYCVILQFVVGLLPKFLARKEFDRALRMVSRTYYYFEARLYGNKRITFISNLMVY